MKKAQSLTASSLNGLTSGRRVDLSMPGLSVTVNRSGKKVWTFRRRIAGVKTIVSMTLGTYPAHTIAAARQWAASLNLLIERGEDPRGALGPAKISDVFTVADAHQIYMTAVRRGDRKILKPRTLLDKEVIFKRDISPRLGNAPLATLSEDECWDAVYDKAGSSKDRANKMAGELSCFLKWCAGREGRMAGIVLPAHPAPTLNSNWFSTGSKANRRFLSHEELSWLMHALCDQPSAYQRGVLLLLLTAARRNELFGARASEIVDGLWTLPADRSKNGLENYVALGPWGRRLAQTNGEWLFPSPRVDGPQLYGWFKARDALHARMEELAGRPLERWHFHDLRRTFRSHAREVGIDHEIAELMLNHQKKGLARIYDSNKELDLRKQGFAAWEAFLLSIAQAEKLTMCLGAFGLVFPRQ